jgi:excisionase family DNA binding protein
MSQHAHNIPPDMPHDGTRHATDTVTDMSPPLRATVEEAAKILGTSENAVRKRIERGTLPSEKVDGVRYVLLLDSDIPQHAADTAGGSVTDMSTDMPHDLALMQAHLDSMQEQVSYLKAVVQTRDEELRRKDHIIAALTERIPELEPPREASSETREAPRMTSENHSGTSPPPDEEHASWWKRFFGLQ